MGNYIAVLQWKDWLPGSVDLYKSFGLIIVTLMGIAGLCVEIRPYLEFPTRPPSGDDTDTGPDSGSDSSGIMDVGFKDIFDGLRDLFVLGKRRSDSTGGNQETKTQVRLDAFFMLLLIALAFGSYVAWWKGTYSDSFANYCVLFSIIVVVWVSIGRLIHGWVHTDHSWGQVIVCAVCFFSGSVFFVWGYIYFKKSTSDKDLTPAVSRSQNRVCESHSDFNKLFGNVFDLHDLWHFLSALGLFFGMLTNYFALHTVARRGEDGMPLLDKGGRIN